MTDPIADMLIRIKNAQAAGKESAFVGHSNLKWEIARTLERAGFLGEAQKKGKKGKRLIELKLLYDVDGKGKVLGAKRISKSSRRVYKGYGDIYPVRNGFGIAVYSTPKGIKTNREARKEKIGGEALFEMW